MNEEQKKRFAALITGDETKEWQERVMFREKNKAWLDKSGQIAVTVLHVLDAKNVSKKELAARMGVSPQQVSKILQGNENMTLQTITSIEAALGVELINITPAAAALKAINKSNKPRKGI